MFAQGITRTRSTLRINLYLLTVNTATSADITFKLSRVTFMNILTLTFLVENNKDEGVIFLIVAFPST